MLGSITNTFSSPRVIDETLAKVVDTIQIIVDSEKFTVTKFEFTETGADHQGKITDVKVAQCNKQMILTLMF